MIGKTISHYRVTEKLGSGGMGVVYKATDLQLQRTVALKFLPPDATVNAADKERFLSEARSASALDHPNIGVIHGLEETPDGQLFIVMTFYEGETLQQKLRNGGLPLRNAIQVATQVAGGLAAAHRRKIVHRDIKPSNIIITTGGLAKIVDFGLARVAATASMTQSAAIAGTPAYMSPEQTMGGVVDERADVWALGVVLVETITGVHPFSRENTAALTFAILNQPPDALDSVPSLLQPTVYRALSKAPEHRYPTAAEMLIDLEEAQQQLAAGSHSDLANSATLTSALPAKQLKEILARASAPQWTPKPTKKKAWPVFAGIAIAVVAALAFLLFVARDRVAGAFASAGAKHIAVLPFDNIGGDPGNATLAEGLLDSLTSKLTNLDSTQQSLWVVPASVVRTRKITDPSSAERELGANLVVKGSIQRDAQTVRLTVNLIDAKNLRQMGSAALEDRAGDLATLQDEAIARLAKMMNIRVTADMLHSASGSVVPAAYDSYLKALGYMQRYDKTGNLDLAVSTLTTAVQTDPRFAVGYAALGEAYRMKNQVDPNPKWIEEASANLQHAVQLDDRLPAPYVSLGYLHSALGQHDLALQEFQRALTINPRDADAETGLARAYERMGRPQDAENSLKKAIALRPDYWDGFNNLGLFYQRQEKFDIALVQFQKVVELVPDNATGYNNIAAAYQSKGDPASLAAAETALNKSIALAPSYAAYANLGNVFLEDKRYSDSVAMTQKALQLNDRDYAVWDNLRLAYMWLGDEKQAAAARGKTIGLLEIFLQSHPQDSGAQVLLAKLYAADNKHEAAQPHLDSALALSPKDADVLADAAETYALLGNTKRAQELARASFSNGEKLDDLKSRFGLHAIFADPNFRISGKN
jgi:serine/threonine-protein kinase